MALTKVQTIGIETGVSLTGVTTVTTLNASTNTLSVGGTVNFGGNVSIAGTLTYEDVTNIDSVGIITARSDISIADKIIHTGDTNTAIRFPAADTFTVETGGSEAIRIDSSGRTLFGTTTSRAVGGVTGSLQLEGTTFATSSMSLMNNSTDTNPAFITLGKSKGGSLGSNTVVASNDYLGIIKFVGADGTDAATESARIECRVDGTPGSNDMPGRLIFSTTADGASSSTERLRIDSSGRLLAGSTSVGYTDVADNLTLADSGHCGITIRSGSSSSGNIYFSDTTGQAAGTYAGIVMYNHTNNNMQFWTNSVAHMLIDSSGRLLVGSSSTREVGYGDNASLQLEGTSYPKAAISSILNSNNANGPSLNFAKSRGTSNGTSTVVQNNDILGLIAFSGGDGTDIRTIGARIQASVDGTPGANDMPGRLMFSTTADGAASPTERMRITSAGLVGIGDVAPSEKLNVGGNIMLEGSDQFIYYTNAGTGNSGIYIRGRTSANELRCHSTGIFTWETTGVERMRIDSSGRLLIGRTSYGLTGNGHTIRGSDSAVFSRDAAGESLVVCRNSSDGDLIQFRRNSTICGEIRSNGSTSTSYQTSSDYRLKENIVDITEGINRVKQLAPKRFNFIADGPITVDGFLAHEAQAVVPESVSGTKDEVDADGNAVMQGIDQAKLVPLLTAALQEAIAKIETLETKVAALEVGQ